MSRRRDEAPPSICAAPLGRAQAGHDGRSRPPIAMMFFMPRPAHFGADGAAITFREKAGAVDYAAAR